MNYRQIYAQKAERERRIKKAFPNIPYESGIYAFTRVDELGIRYCYCGQAKSLCERVASHLAEYDHIGLSLKKRGLYSENNVYGWKVDFKTCSKELLDEKEKESILFYATNGWQIFNKTAGSQGVGKTQINEYRPSKGYRDGIKQGYLNASKEISELFDKHLNFTTKSDVPNKYQQRAIEKFNDFLGFHKKEKE